MLLWNSLSHTLHVVKITIVEIFIGVHIIAYLWITPSNVLMKMKKQLLINQNAGMSPFDNRVYCKLLILEMKINIILILKFPFLIFAISMYYKKWCIQCCFWLSTWENYSIGDYAWYLFELCLVIIIFCFVVSFFVWLILGFRRIWFMRVICSMMMRVWKWLIILQFGRPTPTNGVLGPHPK